MAAPATPATPRASLILPRASSHSHSQPSAGGLSSDRVAASRRRRGDFVFVVNPSGVKSKLDIGVMEGPNREPHFFVNVADIHLSAKAGYFASMYKRFGNLCYVFGALRAFWGHNNRDMRIKVNEGEWRTVHKVTALCVGNAKYFGGGMKITPTADPFSGNLEVVILQDFKWYDFVLKLHRLYGGTHLSVNGVSSIRVQSIEVEVTASSDIFVQSDGEHFGFLPTKFSVHPGAVDFFC